MPKMTEEMRQQVSEDCKGRVIENFYYESEGDYWVMEFEDGAEMCMRLMNELV